MSVKNESNPKRPHRPTNASDGATQRGVDADYCTQPKDGGDSNCVDTVGHGGADGVFYNNEIAKCTADQVAYSDARDFNVGTFVWSGFDYLGESAIGSAVYALPPSRRRHGVAAATKGAEPSSIAPLSAPRPL